MLWPRHGGFFTGNGGAIFNVGTLALSGTWITNNSSAGSGSAIYNYQNGRVDVYNSTISNNTAAGDSGAIQTDSAGMVAQLRERITRYPIISVEDGLSEDDWQHWPALHSAVQGRAITLGDDFLCTNPQRIKRAIETDAADALLLKVNQIGSLTEAMQAMKLAKGAGWKVVVSARSGWRNTIDCLPSKRRPACPCAINLPAFGL